MEPDSAGVPASADHNPQCENISAATPAYGSDEWARRRVFAAVQYMVGHVCDQWSKAAPEGLSEGLFYAASPVEKSGTVQFDVRFVNALSAALVQVVQQAWVPDLNAFAKHARRSIVQPADVLLLLRRNPDALRRLQEVASTLPNPKKRPAGSGAATTSTPTSAASTRSRGRARGRGRARAAARALSVSRGGRSDGGLPQSADAAVEPDTLVGDIGNDSACRRSESPAFSVTAADVKTSPLKSEISSADRRPQAGDSDDDIMILAVKSPKPSRNRSASTQQTPAVSAAVPQSPVASANPFKKQPSIPIQSSKSKSPQASKCETPSRAAAATPPVASRRNTSAHALSGVDWSEMFDIFGCENGPDDNDTAAASCAEVAPRQENIHGGGSSAIQNTPVLSGIPVPKRNLLSDSNRHTSPDSVAATTHAEKARPAGNDKKRRRTSGLSLAFDPFFD